jgi:hypothetical protein
MFHTEQCPFLDHLPTIPVAGCLTPSWPGPLLNEKRLLLGQGDRLNSLQNHPFDQFVVYDLNLRRRAEGGYVNLGVLGENCLGHSPKVRSRQNGIDDYQNASHGVQCANTQSTALHVMGFWALALNRMLRWPRSRKKGSSQRIFRVP